MDKITLIDNFLTNDECNIFINILNSIEKTNPFTDADGVKNHKYKNKDFATFLYNRLNKLKPNFENVRGIYDTLLLSCYNPGFGFRLHLDNSQYITKTLYGKYRLLIYLNNVEGGETVFYPDKVTQEEISIKPQIGRAVIFEMDNLFHKSNICKSSKYIIASDILSTWN